MKSKSLKKGRFGVSNCKEFNYITKKMMVCRNDFNTIKKDIPDKFRNKKLIKGDPYYIEKL